MLDLEQKMLKDMDGCFFTVTPEGWIRNTGTGIPAWDRRSAMVREQIKAKSEVASKQKEALGAIPVPSNRPLEVAARGAVPPISEIVEVVCQVAQISPEDLMSRSRKKQHVAARQAVVRLVYSLHTRSKNWIGGKMGLDHSTVLHTLTIQGLRAERIERLKSAAIAILRKRYLDIDETVTKIREYRNQCLSGTKCHDQSGGVTNCHDLG